MNGCFVLYPFKFTAVQNNLLFDFGLNIYS